MEQAKIENFQELRKALKRTKWTRADDDELKKHFALKRDDKRIGREIGRTYNAVQARRSKLALVAYRKKIRSISIRKPAPIEKSPLDFEALKTTQAVLIALGYKLTIVKLGN